MTECNCVNIRYVFIVLKKEKRKITRILFGNFSEIDRKNIMITGETLKNVEAKRDEIEKQMLENLDSDHKIRCYSI